MDETYSLEKAPTWAGREETHQVSDTLANLHLLVCQPCGQMFGPSKARLLGGGADKTTEPLTYFPSLPRLYCLPEPNPPMY